MVLIRHNVRQNVSTLSNDSQMHACLRDFEASPESARDNNIQKNCPTLAPNRMNHGARPKKQSLSRENTARKMALTRI